MKPNVNEAGTPKMRLIGAPVLLDSPAHVRDAETKMSINLRIP